MVSLGRLCARQVHAVGILPGLGAGHSNLGLAPLSLRDVPDTQYAVLSTTLAGEPGPAAGA